MTYTYEQALADAPQHVTRRSDLPNVPGWYVCEDAENAEHSYALRWWNGRWFSVFCDQHDAEINLPDNWASRPSIYEILGWCEPWWVTK